MPVHTERGHRQNKNIHLYILYEYLYKIHIHIQIRPLTLLQKEQEKTERQKKSLFHTLSTLVSTHIHNINPSSCPRIGFCPSRNQCPNDCCCVCDCDREVSPRSAVRSRSSSGMSSWHNMFEGLNSSWNMYSAFQSSTAGWKKKIKKMQTSD